MIRRSPQPATLSPARRTVHFDALPPTVIGHSANVGWVAKRLAAADSTNESSSDSDSPTQYFSAQSEPDSGAGCAAAPASPAAATLLRPFAALERARRGSPPRPAAPRPQVPEVHDGRQAAPTVLATMQLPPPQPAPLNRVVGGLVRNRVDALRASQDRHRNDAFAIAGWLRDHDLAGIDSNDNDCLRYPFRRGSKRLERLGFVARFTNLTTHHAHAITTALAHKYDVQRAHVASDDAFDLVDEILQALAAADA